MSQASRPALPSDQNQEDGGDSILPQDMLDYLIEERGHSSVRSSFIFPVIVSMAAIHRVRTAIFQLVETIAISSMTVMRNNTPKMTQELLLAFSYIVLRDELGVKRASFRLDKKGPAQVYASDLVALGDDSAKVTVVYPNTPLLCLQDDEEISVVLHATTNNGKVASHSRHFPATVVFVPRHTNPDQFELVIESRGGLTPREILERAVDVVTGLE